MNRSWIYVGLTSFFELIWILGFNIASTWWHWLFIVMFILIDFYFLTKACESLPTGTVYAIFAGIGTVGTSLMDVFLFNGQLNLGKILFITILVIGVLGLKLSDDNEENNTSKGVV